MKTGWKRLSITAVLAALLGVMALSTVALAQGPAGSGNLDGDVVVGELSELEIEGLLYMREEEKLARDVYLTFAEEWDLRIFGSIANSEQKHMDAIARLLERYDLEDPAETTDIGGFANPTLQELYGELVEAGSGSLADALMVGATIEEIDILDLEEYILQTDEPDIQRVYQSLLRGSGNHLRAFVSALAGETGEAYQPRYLSQESFEAIMGSSPQPGGRRSPGTRGGNGRGRGR